MVDQNWPLAGEPGFSGEGGDRDTVISNSQQWIVPGVILAKSDRGKTHAFGRNRNLPGRSAEICKLDWRGP
ncbi:hypothetical protein [Mesorhizobium sp. SP-1A]|uniref:hypothetical protein n=1 Tax=Mesorhizobium sp. SP-1A TaxID=3077840 RepID=UPI0028F7014E|nr:hypothetical protein [Mesorhizobium sp. SP-1A]